MARKTRERGDDAGRREGRVLDAYEAMQQRRKGRLSDWPQELRDEPNDDPAEDIKTTYTMRHT